MAEDSQAWPLVTAPTTTVLAATARCIKIALWQSTQKSDGRRCGGGKPSSLSADMVVKESGFGELIPEADVRSSTKPTSCPTLPASILVSHLQSTTARPGKRHHHRLPHRIKDTQQLQKCADRLAQSAQDFACNSVSLVIAVTCVSC